MASRLVLLFILAALLPIASLSILAFDHVSETLREQGEERVRTACKAAGISVLGSLRDVELTLSLLAQMMNSDRQAQAAVRTAALRSKMSQHFVSLSVSRPDGRTSPLLGAGSATPDLSDEALSRLASGRTVLKTTAREDGSAAVLMLILLDPADPESELLTAEIDPARFQQVVADGALPPLGRFCLFDDRGAMIVCSGAPIDISRVPTSSTTRSAGSGTFDWHEGQETLLASHWAVFLESLFGARSWTIVLGEPRDEALGSLAQFRAIFPLVVVVFLGVACLLCISQLRRSLGPLSRLQRGTQRIAAGAFDTRLDVQSGDEFEQLAASFNSMAAKLEEQFGLMATMVEIDRAVLSKTESGEISRAILERIRELVDCDMAAVVLLGPDCEANIDIYLSRHARAAIEKIEPGNTSFDELQQALGAQESDWTDLRRVDSRSPFHFLAEAEMVTCLVLPLRADSVVFGGLVLGFREQSEVGMAGDVHARQVASQASVALQNAQVLEANKVLAYYDSLTQLPNRLLFNDRLEQALLDVHRNGGRLAVCLIDLDGFKRINDTFGHDAGDRLLQEQGRRIAAVLRRGTVARMGGDEFTLLIRDFDREEIPALVMNRIIDELRQPVDIRGQQVVTTASIGIAVYPDDGSTADALLKNADSAMYHAKSRGRNCCQFYTESMTAAAMEQLELESQLRGAIEREEFFVEYQPVFEADSRRIDGVEALVRWRHPTRGIVPPGIFIPVAEETGLITEIGKWVLHRACSDIASLLAQEGEPLHLAVNVSAVQFSNPDLPAQVEAILLQTGFPAQQLVLEMTESMLIESVDDTLHRLKELRRVGARLSIDDFGTGYSSLSYLKYFSIDFLKIDRSFITDLSRRADDVAITKAIIAMAHSLSLEVIAEGVETEGQLRFLQEHDCEYAQGFLLSPALALDALAKLLRSE